MSLLSPKTLMEAMNRKYRFRPLRSSIFIAGLILASPSAFPQTQKEIIERNAIYADAYEAIEEHNYPLAYSLLQQYSALAGDVFARNPDFKKKVYLQISDLQKKLSPCPVTSVSAARNGCCKKISAARSHCS